MDKVDYIEPLIGKLEDFLDKLKDDLNKYSEEEIIWSTEGQVSNSAGNLVLHLIGNLNHFIGAVLGKTGYERNRPVEFSKKNVPRVELIKEINSTREMVSNVMMSLDSQTVDGNYPLDFDDEQPSTREWMLQILTHLSYHTGQINYHRRLLDV